MLRQVPQRFPGTPYHSRLSTAAGALLALGLLATPAAGRCDEVDVSHWAIAPFTGTGIYRIGDDRDVIVLQATPRWRIRETGEATDAGRGTAGFEFLLPVAVGLNRFDLADIPELVEFDNVATLSVVPGVHMRIPMDDRWSLLALANAGIGVRLDGEEAAFTYRIGIRSRWCIDSADCRWRLVNAFEYAGYATDRDRESALAPISAAIEFESGLGRMSIDDQPVRLVTHVEYSDFLDDLEFSLTDELDTSIGAQLEIGTAFKTDAGLEILGLKLDRVGIAYRRGLDHAGPSDTDYEAIRLYFRSLFEQ